MMNSVKALNFAPAIDAQASFKGKKLSAIMAGFHALLRSMLCAMQRKVLTMLF